MRKEERKRIKVAKSEYSEDWDLRLFIKESERDRIGLTLSSKKHRRE